MTDLGWRADGIERARAAGGVELELYRRPGFGGRLAVRRSQSEAGGAGVPIEGGEYFDFDPAPEDFRRRRR